MSVVTNGVSFDLFSQLPDPAPFRKLHNLENRFVVAYVGTHGLAHNLDVILMAADRLRAREDIAFVLVGDGAERERLVERCRSMSLPNVRMMAQLPRDQMPTVWAASDAAIITLRPGPTFELVIPSKMFEAMAMKRPIILGVRGHALEIVEKGECGLAFTPGDASALANQVVALADDLSLRQRLGDNGFRLVKSNYDRDKLARKYLAILEDVALGWRAGSTGACTRERLS